MKIRVGCELVYNVPESAPIISKVALRTSMYQKTLDEARTLEPQTELHTFEDEFGNNVWRLMAPQGKFSFVYDALAEVSPEPDPVLPELDKHLAQDLPDDVLVYTLPSRYCQSDLFVGDALEMFGAVSPGWAQVQAVCDWLHDNITYEAGSTPATTSKDAFDERRGVCRDFAHLGITFSRALNIPARYVCGYLPDIAVENPPDVPMDVHALFEVYLGGGWRTFYARHNQPRVGRALIAYGRDAVDAAFATTYGATRLETMRVWADEVNDTPTLGEPPND